MLGISLDLLAEAADGTAFVGGITLNATHQNPSPDSLAALPAGLALPNGRRILTTQQFASAIVPVGGPTGIHLTGTFIWGALNDFENEPFPW